MLKDFLRCSIILWIFVRSLQGLPADEIVRNAKVNEMRSCMNETLDPCEDFYTFSCAHFPKFHPTNSEITKIDFFNLLQTEFDRKLKKLLATDDNTDTEDVIKVKDFYRSCLNLDEFPKGKLLAIISEFGQMPLVEGDRWNERDFDWLKTVAEILHTYGIGILVVAGVLPDLNDNTVKAVAFAPGKFFIEEKKAYFSEEHETIRNSHPPAISENIEFFLDIHPDIAKRAGKEIFDFEIALAHGLNDDGLLPSDFLKSTTEEHMQRKYSPTLDVKQLTSTALGSIPPFGFYEHSDYLQNLIKVIEKTPKNVVANYIYYKLMDEFTFPVFDDEEARQNACIAEVKKTFPLSVESLVYHKYNTQQTKDDIDDMWKNIKLAFVEVLRSPRLSWMGEDTRQYAVEKMNAMEIVIPAITLNSSSETDKLLVNKQDFIENVRQLKIAEANKYRDSIYRPVEAVEAEELNSYSAQHVLMKNVVTVPVGFLQPHFIWSPAFPNAINFAKLGSLLSHELLHGFDDAGRLFDATGSRREWWDANSINTFNERKQCIAGQYSKYMYGGVLLPEPASQAENIADNGGIRLAYQAYLKWYGDSVRSRQELNRETFPSLSYTNKQLFFINYAQLWCSSTDPESRIVQAASDEHAPNEIRIIGTLSNLKEFSEEFNCPLGSGMNPIEKCDIY